MDLPLEDARKLVAALENGDREQAEAMIERLGGGRFQPLLLEVGRLTRDVREAIDLLGSDSRLLELTQDAIPDCRERLDYVVQQTEKAANETIDAVEDMMSMARNLGEDARLMAAASRDGRVTDEACTASLADFAQTVEQFTGALHTRLSDVLLAQSYQDLTSQIIKRTIDVVTQVEAKLLGIVSTCAPLVAADTSPASEETEAAPTVHGPAATVREQAEAVADQADVDDLLASLGV